MLTSFLLHFFPFLISTTTQSLSFVRRVVRSEIFTGESLRIYRRTRKTFDDMFAWSILRRRKKHAAFLCDSKRFFRMFLYGYKRNLRTKKALRYG